MLKTTFASLAAVAAVIATPAAARTLDPAVGADALEISKRMQCGVADGETAVYSWEGAIYSRVRGEKDRHLFNGVGMNIRRCVSVDDPQRGKGYRLISREVMLYLDPETNEVLKTWENPWTGETVDVVHIDNDPVNQRPQFPITTSGEAYSLGNMRIWNDWALMRSEIPLWYKNPLAGDYEKYIGGTYHSMEIFDFSAKASELLDTRYPTAYPVISWVRLSEWMPWMEMNGRNGTIVFNAMGTKLRGGFDDLPDVLKREIAANYPKYTDAPPANDTRPNETTWTVFKDYIDAKREAEGATAKPTGH